MTPLLVDSLISLLCMLATARLTNCHQGTFKGTFLSQQQLSASMSNPLAYVRTVDSYTVYS